jgi:hypothetical protein
VTIKKTKKKPLTTIEMEVAIAKFFGVRQNIIVPNISWGFQTHECDLFIIKKSGIAIEVEIKRSKSDLLADFKKRHNHKDRQNRITEFYYAFTIELLNNCYDLIPKETGIIVCERYKNHKNEEVIGAHIKRNSERIKWARKLTDKEIFKIARLGCMRIFSLKNKIIKLQQKLATQ